MTESEAGAGPFASPLLGGPGRTPAALTLLGITAICLVFAFLLYDAYVDARQNAERATSNIAALVEQDIARNIDLYELSMRGVAEGVMNPQIMSLEPALRNRLIFDRSAAAPGLGSLLALDETGRISVVSLPDADMNAKLSDRDYFRAHREATSDIGLYVSEPFQSRLRNKDWTVALSSRIKHADGSFAGVVVGSISLSYFSDLFNKVAIGHNGTIALFKTNGTLLMRTPYIPPSVTSKLAGWELLRQLVQRPTGNFEATAAVDGVRRLYAFHRVGDLPLVVTVGFSVEEIYAGWWRKSLITGLSLVILCAFVLLLMHRLRAELGRRTKAEAALSALAATDSLTGLANRRKFDQVLDLEWRRAERDGSIVALIMVDVDFFKAFNDAYGHQDGDRVLRAVAKQVALSIGRPADVCARYGGEEFVTLLPHTDAAGAARVAEKIRAAVLDLQIAHARSPHAFLTVSLGAAAMKPRYSEHPTDLVKAADAALYASKAAGRNRTTLAPMPAPSEMVESDPQSRLQEYGPSVEDMARSA